MRCVCLKVRSKLGSSIARRELEARQEKETRALGTCREFEAQLTQSSLPASARPFASLEPPCPKPLIILCKPKMGGCGLRGRLGRSRR